MAVSAPLLMTLFILQKIYHSSAAAATAIQRRCSTNAPAVSPAVTMSVMQKTKQIEKKSENLLKIY